MEGGGKRREEKWAVKELRNRDISVGAQSTLGGHDIFARKNMYEKLTNCPNFT